MNPVPTPPKRSAASRFWKHVNKDGPIPVHCPELGPCWVWTGGTMQGYGVLYNNEQHGALQIKAHRLGYELQIGPVPDDLMVCHKCDNRPCVRGSHLFPGTNADNMQDMYNKGRHPLIRGEKSNRGHLTESDVREIRRQYAVGGISQDALARQWNTAQSAISSLIRRETWAHVS